MKEMEIHWDCCRLAGENITINSTATYSRLVWLQAQVLNDKVITASHEVSLHGFVFPEGVLFFLGMDKFFFVLSSTNQ